MRNLLLAGAALVAAVAVPALPAEAQSRGSPGYSSGGSAHVMRGGGGTRVRGDFGDHEGRRRDRGRHDRRGDTIVVDNSEWYDDWDGGRSWESDSYNDWWHDNPSRAYPRWVTAGNCDRLWWGGGQWRCTW